MGLLCRLAGDGDTPIAQQWHGELDYLDLNTTERYLAVCYDQVIRTIQDSVARRPQVVVYLLGTLETTPGSTPADIGSGPCR